MLPNGNSPVVLGLDGALFSLFENRESYNLRHLLQNKVTLEQFTLSVRGRLF